MSLQDEMSIALDDVATNDWYKTSLMDEDRLDPRDLDNISVFSKSDRGYSPGAVLTPPDSQIGSPREDRSEGNAFISVSTTFYPGANTDAQQTDIIILSSDSVFFYVHSARLLAASENGFNSHLPLASKDNTSDSDAIIAIPERSAVINIVLHAIYGMSCTHYSPSFEELEEAVATLQVYGLTISTFASPGSPLSNALLTHAPTRPLDLYALAASYGLHELAVSTSPHLLSFSLPSLSDEMAERIGPIYLKKLFFLHLGRTDALKRLLLPPPHPHAPTSSCDFVEQKKLTRAWALASAYLTWDARPDMSASTIESSLHPLADHLSCEVCKQSLRERIRDLVVQWSVVKRTV